MQDDAMPLGWFVDVSAWDPASRQWERALQWLSEEERRQVAKFVFAKDQRLALASRLLQRRLLHDLFHVPMAGIRIQRTPEGKPYWQRDADGRAPPFWNYNVSHHGTVVAIAAHAHALVGVDVVQLSERPRRRQRDASAEDFFRAFTDYFTPSEWHSIRRPTDESAQFHAFYRLWSLKEAFIKAIGIGLGFQLLRAEFVSDDPREVDWRMRLDGQEASQWRFRSLRVASSASSCDHLVSIALGPVAETWNPHTSSIFPAGHDATTAPRGGYQIPSEFCWQEKTLDELIAETTQVMPAQQRQ